MGRGGVSRKVGGALAKGMLLIPDFNCTLLFIRSCLDLQNEHNYKILLQNEVRPLVRSLIITKLDLQLNDEASRCLWRWKKHLLIGIFLYSHEFS